MLDKIKLAFACKGKSLSIAESDMDYEKETQGEIVGPFAIHKELLYNKETDNHYEGDFYAVSHISTGCRVATPGTGRFESIEQAKLFIEKIQVLARWSDITKEAIRANPERWAKLSRKVKSAYREVTG